MLRLLLLVACLLVSACSTVPNNKYTTVTGEGPTLDRAKQNAFRQAVQLKVGSAVVSEQVATVNKLVKDDIIVHSAGYVDDFKVLDTILVNGTYRVTIDVLVSDSKISNMILNSGKSEKNIDGSRASTSVSTYMAQKKTGDKLLGNVLSGYPKHAYIIEQGEYTIGVNQYRNTTFAIAYKLKWNYDYLASLNEVLSKLEDGGSGIFGNQSIGNVTIMAKNPKDWLIGRTDTYRFNDLIRTDQIKSSMNGNNEVRIKVSVYDSNFKSIYESCVAPLFVNGYSKSFYAIGNTNYTVFYGNESENGLISLPPNLHGVINKSNSVELSVVPVSDCQK